MTMMPDVLGMGTRDDVWRRLEREARAESQRALAAIEAAPLEVGAFIAWVECSPYGHQTEDLSLVHRVAVPDVPAGEKGETPATYCGEAIPEAVRRFPLTPRLVCTMRHCRWCEISYGQSASGRKT